MMRIDPISRPVPVQMPLTPPSRSSYTDGLVPSDDSSPSPPSPPPPPMATVTPHTAATPSYVKYSTLARLQTQSQTSWTQPVGVAPPSLPVQCPKSNYNTLPAAYGTSPPPSPPPPPPPETPPPGSAAAALMFGVLPPPPPPLEEDLQEPAYLPPPPPPESPEANGPPPPPPQAPAPDFGNSGLQQFLSQKFPHMVYDFSQDLEEDAAPPPPPAGLSPPSTLQVLRPLSPGAPPPPAPPKTFTGGFPPQTARKPSGPASLPMALSPVSPTQPFGAHGPVKKQQSFSTGHSPSQPPPTLPKQHSLSSKNLAVSPSSLSSSVSIAAATSSLVKQIVNQFPGNSAPCSLPASNSMEGSKFTAPQSPPAVKAKPRWQPGGVVAPQSPEFPPPPADEFPPPPPSTGSGKRGPPPAPQRASSVSLRCGSSGEFQDEWPTKVESLVSKFGQTPPTGAASGASSATGSPSKESSSALPAPLPKPGKLNLANLPLALQGLQAGQHHQPAEFPSPPPPPPPALPPHLDSSPDYFPPPPSDFELFPPPPHPSEFHQPPKVAVVNPQPQMHPPQPSAPSSLSSSSWKQSSLKKGAVLPPSLSRRISNATLYDGTLSMPLAPLPLSQTPPPSLSLYCTTSSSPSSSSPVPPTSPKSPGPSTLTLKPHFLEDLNRTLKRKSVSRHGSLTSSHLISSSKMEPVGTVDDMALLPPPPPELLQQHGVRGHSQTLSRHHTHSHSAKHASISGYATLRRGPPPAPPKRDQNTKLTGDW
ncbi:hypothetical protein EYF80_041790 [Liparis tanakae]|uniref:Ras-associated and pleckstrin y domains-containing protein 1 n=1 Tax=Liparis tanakae TaxID=230148 RepID=A0A4Z2G3B0_9TELE|nr:hypothetical protein EYF80_041790 [Liparis tanakae]